MALVTVWRGRSLGVCTLLISVCFDGGPVHRVCLPVLVDKTRHVKVTPQKQAHSAVLPAQNWGHFPKSGLRSLRYSPLRPHAGSNVCCTEQLGSPRDSCSHVVTRQDASRDGWGCWEPGTGSSRPWFGSQPGGSPKRNQRISASPWFPVWAQG